MSDLIQHPKLTGMACYRIKNKVYATAQQIAEGTQTNRATIQRVIKKALESGILSEDDARVHNVYTSIGPRESVMYSQKAIMIYIARMGKHNQFARDYLNFVEDSVNRAIITEDLTDIRNVYNVVKQVITKSSDYDSSNWQLFAELQNKIYYAIARAIATEIVYNRCNPHANNCGMTTSIKSVTSETAKLAYNYLYTEEVELYQHFIQSCDMSLRGFILKHHSYKTVDVIRIIDNTINSMQLPQKPESHYGMVSREQLNHIVKQRVEVYHRLLSSGVD